MEMEYMNDNTEANDYYEDIEAQQAAKDLFQGNDMSKLVKAFLEDEKRPHEVLDHKLYKHFWSIVGKTPKITFLTDKDILEFHSRFRQAKFVYLMSMPKYEFSFEELQLLKQLEIEFILSLKRSVGVPKHVMNERGLLSTTIHQRIRTNTEGIMNSGGGFVNRIKRMF